MYVVAIVELRTPLDVEAKALADTLGGTAYEHRMHLLGGFPATVLTTADPELAQRTLGELRRRGHGAALVEGREVVPSDRMIAVRRFRFEPAALVVEEPVPRELPASDILALLRGVHRTRTDTRAEVTKKSFSLGRTLASGGLMTSKTTKHEERSTSAELDPVLYVFRASGETPWLLRERGTNYSGLGKELQPSSMQNFLAVIRLLRKLAPHAVYDERLMNLRGPGGPPLRTSRPGEETVTTSTASSLDIAAHLLARWIRER